VEGLGRNHSFETAIADLVDNSIDAEARRILIRFVRDEAGPVAVYILDDGRGMSEAEIDLAMTLGGRRPYAESDLGHFGIGLKASSLGQARSLTVVSRKSGHPSVARRLVGDQVADAFECDILSEAFAGSILNRSWDNFEIDTGTVVIWSEIRSFPKMVHGSDIEAFLSESVSRLARHLGLIFHRFLSSGALCITIDQEDFATSSVGVPFPVLPVDPFAYANSARADFPRVLVAESDTLKLDLTCHIWPGRSNRANFKLLEGAGKDFQGFFFYRNNRLIQAGGWNGVVQSKDDLQLARISIEVPPGGDILFKMNPEKTKVSATDAFVRSVYASHGADCTFSSYLDQSAEAYKDSRKRVSSRPRVLPPGAGISPAVKAALSDEFDFIEGAHPFEIRWEHIDGNGLFEVEKQGHLVRLNRRYRSVLTRSERGSLNDAPVVKALLYLLVEGAMRGEYFGARDRDNISIWQAVLTAAAEAEK
jgi:hypothetical protein